MIVDVLYPQTYLRMHPADDDVFADPVQKHRRHLMPLVSVDLSVVNPAWQGWVHVVNPYEPEDGIVGQSTGQYHAGFVQANWLAFHLDADNRYHWLGDWRYFQLELDEGVQDEAERAVIEKHYRVTEQAYQAKKAEFLAHGCLPCPWDETEPFNLLNQIGGSAAFDNWASSGTSGAVPLNIDNAEDVYPSMPDGRRFYFVCELDADVYGDYGPGIIVFFEPESRTVVMTFNWS
ncbi:hypothetical protein DFR42_104199 [Undibacterium pigrum]|uniref:DUF1963 domain-containing protein n=2 Tax=Undibacterium pigrum TaxID=401470 RepID=A0A318JHR3_9BURK|nr:hypothetical protein DFR42_104199 [Undibacterium pigrum]